MLQEDLVTHKQNTHETKKYFVRSTHSRSTAAAEFKNKLAVSKVKYEILLELLDTLLV